MFGHGELRCGKAVVVRVGLDGSVVVSQGGHVPVRRNRVWSGSVCYGKGGGHGSAGYDLLSCGMFRQGGRGPVRCVWAWRVTAVGERSGLDGFGELGRINGMVRLGF